MGLAKLSAAWLATLGGSSAQMLAIAAFPSAATTSGFPDHPLMMDLGYGVYEGYYNSTSKLNIWKGYDNPHSRRGPETLAEKIITTARSVCDSRLHPWVTSDGSPPRCPLRTAASSPLRPSGPYAPRPCRLSPAPPSPPVTKTACS